jgi:hypothetical protein
VPTPEPTPEPTPPADQPTPPADPPTPEPTADQPAPEPTPAPAPAPAPTPPPPKPAAKPFVDDYYTRKGGLGVFHNVRLALGMLSGTAPNFVDDMAPMMAGETKDVTAGSIAFEGSFLALPSSYGHFHGLEFSTGLRSTPIDYWLQFGSSVSLLNVGHGGPGSFRLGGGFGAGFNFAHGYGYVRGRVAFVVIRAKLDVEVTATWTPPSASTGNYDERLYRASAWYRPGKSKRAFELFAESLRRADATGDYKREIDGVGGGLGMTFF